MPNHYTDTINETTALIREGMRQSPNAEQREMWIAMLERLACIEAMEGGNV